MIKIQRSVFLHDESTIQPGKMRVVQNGWNCKKREEAVANYQLVYRRRRNVGPIKFP